MNQAFATPRLLLEHDMALSSEWLGWDVSWNHRGSRRMEMFH